MHEIGPEFDSVAGVDAKRQVKRPTGKITGVVPSWWFKLVRVERDRRAPEGILFLAGWRPSLLGWRAPQGILFLLAWHLLLVVTRSY